MNTVIARLFRYIWAAPCTALGICFALPALLLGGGIRIAAGVVEVFVSNTRSKLLESLSFCAITFGHLVIAKTEGDLHRLREHEHEHVRQYEKWGALFFVAYPAVSFWQLLQGRRPYWDNCFEVAAREKETYKKFGS